MNIGSSSASAPPVIDGWLRLCLSAALVERGEAVLFDLPLRPGARAAQRGFAVRFDAVPRAYVNRCAHVPVALDWVPGQVFDPEGQTLLCSVHGAEYAPDAGHCLSGPCRGRGHLEALPAAERDGWVWIRIHSGVADQTGRSSGGTGSRSLDPPATLDFRDDD